MATIRSLGYGVQSVIESQDAQRFAYDAEDRVEYVGYADPGTSESDAAWAIKKLTYSVTGKPTATTWAGGSQERTKVWTDYAGLTYS
jgi:hypothetical protein